MFTKSHTRHGVNVPRATWKIAQVNMIGWPEIASVNFHIFASPEAAERGDAPIDTREVVVSIESAMQAAPDTTSKGLEAGLQAAVMGLEGFEDAKPA